MIQWLQHVIYFAVCIVIISCASRATPSGGPRDEQPPRIVEEASTPNQQTQFSERRIVLEMDEWVKLEDAQTQVLVSPPLEQRPDIRLRGRQVIFEFDEEEVLRENATYTINFGNAIQDITEGNPLENFSFVFATGAQIDSLFIEGVVMDAYTGEPVEDVLVMVHESSEDSVIFTEKPFYASRTDEEGHFRIENMKEGDFKITAIKDENLNYTYESASEEIAFLDTLFTVSASPSPPIQLLISKEQSQLYLDRLDTSGWNTATVTYSRTPFEIAVSYDEEDGTLLYGKTDQNPITIWYYSQNRTQWRVYLTDTIENTRDTLLLRRDSDQSELPKLAKVNEVRNSGHPEDPFYICFDRPITQIDTGLVRLLMGRDSVEITPELEISDSIPGCIVLQNQWSPDSMYRLTLLPGALLSLSGVENDTLNEQIPIGNEERFGTVVLRLENLDSTKTYLVELMENDQARRTLYVTGASSRELQVEKMRPATYALRVTEDRNQNGRWDPGNYLEKIQPEPTRIAEIEPLRANWDVEVNFKWTTQ